MDADQEILCEAAKAVIRCPRCGSENVRRAASIVRSAHQQATFTYGRITVDEVDDEGFSSVHGFRCDDDGACFAHLVSRVEGRETLVLVDECDFPVEWSLLLSACHSVEG